MNGEHPSASENASPQSDTEVGPDASGSRDAHIRGVEATSTGLVKATLGSAIAAGAILVLFWLPAEYGIDATGLGGAMGLTEMGEIKQQLFAEAEAEDAALAAQSMPTQTEQTMGGAELAERLSAIEAQLATIAAAIASAPSAENVEATPTPAPVVEQPATPTWRDEVSYTLAPTEGIEVKLVMEEGAVAEFEWTANGAVLNHDTHGNGSGQRITYEKGRGVPGQVGELAAAFSGNHGWFWRNRTDEPVTFTLRTRGDYRSLKAP